MLCLVILIGDAGVGKSSCVTRFTRNEFFAENQSTLIVDFERREMLVSVCSFSPLYIRNLPMLQIDDKTVMLQIWDTSGQERYRSVTMAYYRGAVGALIFYDITRRVSFKNVEFWLREVQVLGREVGTCI
jgi:Ras-related protein Rab-11A